MKRQYVKHGRTQTREYYVWNQMRQRCTNPRLPNFHRYGGRGIAVCERWMSFDNFIADMGPRPTEHHQLDRIDNDGPYSPQNCRWANHRQQNTNRSTNTRLTYNGLTLTACEWAERLGISRATFWLRRKNGWADEYVFAKGRHGNNQYTGAIPRA